MAKGQTLALRHVQGKTRQFFVMVQDHLYEDNIKQAPVIARGRGFAIAAGTGLFLAATTTLLVFRVFGGVA